MSPSDTQDHPPVGQRRIDTAILFAIAAAVALLHLLTNNRYGFHRDELQFLSDARHLDWGFVAYPPLTPFLERIGLGLFGLSMVGLRLFSVLAQVAVIVLGGLMARELGGSRLAQVTAALAVAFSPMPLFSGTQFQYTSFDLLWWVLIAYFVDSPPQVGRSALVPGNWRNRWHRPAHQIRHRLLHRGHSGRPRPHARAPFPQERVVLGRCGVGFSDLSA